MAIEVRMPKLGLTMVDGKIVEWKKKPGESVEAGEVICVIETEKTTYEIEAPGAGTLAKIVVDEGSTVPVGELMGIILGPGEELAEVPAAAPEATAKAEKPAAPAKEEIPPARVEAAEVGREVKSSPLARKIAAEHGINLATVKGTGPGGRIAKEDVLRAIEAGKAKAPPTGVAPAEEGVIPLTTMRKTIARRMSQSFHTAPHFWVTAEADVTELTKLYKQLGPRVAKDTGVKLTYTDLLIKIVALALKEHPNVNACWTEDGIKVLSEINIGIATDIPTGLIVPVIRRAGEKSLAEISADRAALVAKGREGKMTLDEMTGGTFTLNNVGALGISCIHAIINPPESAILTVGSTTERPVVVGGQIVARPVMELSLGVDHRVLDGGSGGRFLMKVKELIEQPLSILFKG